MITWTGRSRAGRATRSNAPKSWRHNTFVAIDLETTGLDPVKDHIVSYGAVPIQRGSFRPADALYSLVSSPIPVPDRATRIHTLRDQDLTHAPELHKCVDALDAALRGAVLVGYKVDIERFFLRRAFREYGRRFDVPMIDVAELVRMMDGPYSGHAFPEDLETAAAVLDLPIHPPHHALGDALTTATLFLAAATYLERQFEPLTTSRLLAISDARMGRQRRTR